MGVKAHPLNNMASNKVLEIDYGAVIAEPVTLSEVKTYLKVDGFSNDDAFITELITAAREYLEVYCNVAFVEREMVAVLDNSLGGVEVPMGIHESVDEVLDEEGNAVAYKLKGNQYKTIESPVTNYLKVTFTGGYETLPKIFKDALLAQIAWMYENRGDVNVKEIAPQAEALLAARRRVFNEFFL